MGGSLRDSEGFWAILGALVVTNSGSAVAHNGRESEGDWETEGDKKEEEEERDNIFREESNNLSLNQNHALITGSKSGEPFCVADHTVWRCPCFPKKRAAATRPASGN